MVPITRLKTQCFLKGFYSTLGPTFSPIKFGGLFEVNARKKRRGGGVRARSTCTWAQLFFARALNAVKLRVNLVSSFEVRNEFLE